MTHEFFEIVRSLENRLAGGSKWSLGPTQTLLEHLGHPEREYPSIHIGGTNGKGSVAQLVADALGAFGLRVGLYTSPHLVDIRERMMVSGRPISHESFLHWASAIDPLLDGLGASFFEATTAIAFADFAARRVDVAVIEVGLGGRLDATNVVSPVASAVTSVAIDHTDYLGTSLEEIANEKAGIAKPGVPFVVGEEHAEVATILASAARRRGGVPVLVASSDEWSGPLGLRGRHQRRNAAVAVQVLDVLPQGLRPDRHTVESAFATARLAGRADVRGKWIFDVAHNVASVEALADFVGGLPPRPPSHAVVCFLADKEWEVALARLRLVADRIWVTQAPSAPAARRWDPTRAVACLEDQGVLESNFDQALLAAQQGAGQVLVTGSFHTVGDALARVPGFAPLG